MSDYEKLYSLDEWRIGQRGAVYKDFTENTVRQPDGGYEVRIPLIPGNEPSEANESEPKVITKC